MGLGLFGGGLAAARWLAREGAVVTVTDSASEDRLASSLAALDGVSIHRYRLGEHREEDFREADLIVVNPAVRPGNRWLDLARRAGANLTSEIELFLENCPAPTIGVTGSNGKSTTAAMIASILKADGRSVYLGGNLGGSLLDDLKAMKSSDWVVLELSSFQLHRLSPDAVSPSTAVITNFTPNHLNWHPDLEHYRSAKQQLLVRQSSRDTAVFDPGAAGLSDWRRIVPGNFIAPSDPPELPRLLVPGRHNLVNASLAATTARSLGCTKQAIGIGLSNFRGLPDRLETVAHLNGRRIVNDTSSTTPESTIAALEALDRPLWLMAGGADKGVDYGQLADHIAREADGAVFFGQVGAQLATRTASRAGSLDCHAVGTLQEAFAVCMERAPRGATIVLSPACSSHDQFVNYRARGEALVELTRLYQAQDRNGCEGRQGRRPKAED